MSTEPITAATLDRWIERARSVGAVGAEVLVTERAGVSFAVERGKVLSREPIRERSLSVTAWADHGGHATVSGSPEDAANLVVAAAAAAADADPSPGSGPARRLPALDHRALLIDDRRYVVLTDEERIEAAVAFERLAREEDPCIHTDPFQWTDHRTRRLFASSTGMHGEEWSTRFTATGGVRAAVDGTLVALTDGLDSRFFATLAAIPFGLKLARRLVALVKQPIPVAGPVRVMLTPRATAPLVAAFADALVRGATFLDRGAVLDERLHLLDDGTLPGGLRSHAFDDRGVPPVPVVVLRKGRRGDAFLGPQAARGADTRPTGHWFGGALRPSNLVLRNGTRTMNALLAERSDVDTLVVTDLAGVEGVDWETGEARLVAYGMLRRGKEVLGTVPGVQLTGNLADVLANLVDIASDTDRIGHVDAPGLLVDGFTAS